MQVCLLLTGEVESVADPVGEHGAVGAGQTIAVDEVRVFGKLGVRLTLGHPDEHPSTGAAERLRTDACRRPYERRQTRIA